MSKTSGNVVNPLDLIDDVGVDGFRYYVLADTTYGQDGDFTYEGLIGRYNSDLANIRAELYLGNPKNMGNQLKYADKRNSPCVIIQGSDEKANGKVQIKDLILGAGLTEIKDREEYLKKQTEAQYEVDESSIVEAVREVLARHDVKWG